MLHVWHDVTHEPSLRASFRPSSKEESQIWGLCSNSKPHEEIFSPKTNSKHKGSCYHLQERWRWLGFWGIIPRPHGPGDMFQQFLKEHRAALLKEDLEEVAGERGDGMGFRRCELFAIISWQMSSRHCLHAVPLGFAIFSLQITRWALTGQWRSGKLSQLPATCGSCCWNVCPPGCWRCVSGAVRGECGPHKLT